ncbi:antitoxin of toxin-antitoxin stability system [Sphingomonas sp. Leaf407]|nr:antitoxin of toxin-antitoxin stability system [Sphingomonas sp. Leaf42]KQT28906.1 antitoxin of toxin-antitoxin stability system [Sphingomonas sp. Leaf407]
MTKAAVFTMKIEPELRSAFAAAAEAAHRPASQVVRELMREYIDRQEDARDHAAFVARKVAIAREAIGRDEGRDDSAVSADFARRRAGLVDRI